MTTATGTMPATGRTIKRMTDGSPELGMLPEKVGDGLLLTSLRWKGSRAFYLDLLADS